MHGTVSPSKPLSPAAISRGIDRIKKLRADQTAAWLSGRTRAALAIQARVGNLTVEIVDALQASSYWAENVKASLIAQIKTEAA